ncbi:MAG: GspH/FimT family pseudopilin [Gallionella sp.]
MRTIRSGGFTLIELLITIAIFSITLTYGVSSYRSWVLNSQIRNAAESISNGIMHARAEAVKCNARVAFAMGTASAWAVTHVDACGSLAASSVVESRPSSEGSKNVTVAVTPSGTKTITFGSLGTVVANADASVTPTQFDLSSTGTAAGVTLRPLRVAIGAGGSSRLCDPSIPAKTPPDPRMCY